MKIKRLVLNTLIALIMFPGVLYFATFGHEYYHFLHGKECSRSISLDFFRDTLGHMTYESTGECVLTNPEADYLDPIKEEKNANIFFWIFFIVGAIFTVGILGFWEEYKDKYCRHCGVKL